MAHPSTHGRRIVHGSHSSPHRLRRPLGLTTVSTASFGGGISMREASVREATCSRLSMLVKPTSRRPRK